MNVTANKRLFQIQYRPAVILLTAILALGLIAVPHLIFSRAEQNAAVRAREVLEDGAREQAATLSAILSGQTRLLEMIATSFAHSPDTDITRIADRLEQIAESTDFSHIFFIQANGTACIGDRPNVSARDYFEPVMAGEPVMAYYPTLFSGRPGIVLCVPYRVAGEVIGALAGLLHESEMRDMLVSQAYGGAGFSFLADSAGNIIINAEKEEDLVSETTIAFLADAAFSDGETYRSFLERLQQKQSGTFSVRLQGGSYVVGFVPLGSERVPENDWFIVNVAANTALEHEIGQDMRSTTQMMLLLMVLLGAVLGLIILRTHTRRRRLEKDAEDIRIREEQFRIVTKQSGRNVARYDIANGKFYCDDAAEHADAPRLMEGTPARALEEGVVSAESEADYCAFFEKIASGESPVTVDVVVAHQGARRYCRMTSTTQFSQENKPVTAIISAFDCTEQRAHEIAYAKWQQEMSALPEDVTGLFERNLSRDVAEGASGALARHFREIAVGPLNAQVLSYAERCVHEDDRSAFVSFLNRERLIGEYHSGVFSDNMEYREHADDGEDRWIRLTVQMVQYPDSDEIKSYVIARDIDREKREALLLIERAERDSLTGVLNREAFVERVKRLLADDPYGEHVLMMLDLDGFKLVNDVFGHDVGDETLVRLAGRMRSVLRTSDLLGRMGGDEFMLCLPDMPYRGAAERRAQQLCDLLRTRLSEQVQVSASIGMVVYAKDGSDFDTLYRNADIALYHTKEYGKNGYCFYSPEMCAQEGNKDADDIAQRVDGTKMQVLIVSESASERAALSGFFRDAPYSVTCFHSTGAALQFMSRMRHALPVCILDMDTELGMQLLDTRCGSRELMNVPVLAVCASGNNDQVMRIIRAGADGVLVRPVDDELLRQRVQLIRVRAENERETLQKSFRQMHSIEDERYRQVVQASGTVVFVYDVAARTYSVDPLAKKYIAGDFDTGRTIADVLEQDGVIAKADLDRMWQMLRTVSSGEKKHLECTVDGKTPTGEMHRFRLCIILLDAADEMTRKVLITVNDLDAWAGARG